MATLNGLTPDVLMLTECFSEEFDDGKVANYLWLK